MGIQYQQGPKQMSKLTLIHEGHSHLTGFQYFWLMDVKGFDPSTHCLKCLVGTRIDAVKHSFPTNKPLTLAPLAPGRIYYLCGVSENYAWANNFHLAFVDGDWDVEAHMWNGAKVLLEGIRPIHFDGKAAKRDYPNAGKKFLTCRNFQFAAQHFPVEQDLFQGSHGPVTM
jgi:hypothetical protein